MDPLEEAGYEVAHNGTIAIGESCLGEAEKAITSGMPIIFVRDGKSCLKFMVASDYQCGT